jgi:predicted PurR-regulated permease PerM
VLCVKPVPTFQDKRRVVEIAKEIQTSTARYLVSVTLLNLGLGFSVGFAVGLLGVSNAPMWGVAAFLVNYVPFVGAACGIILVAFASLIQFQKHLVRVLGADLVPCAERSGEQFR